MKKLIKEFFTDHRKVRHKNGLIMTNIFDETFGPFAQLVELLIFLIIIFIGIAAAYSIIKFHH